MTPPSNPNQPKKPDSNEIKKEREDYLSKNPKPNTAGKVRGPAPTLRPAGISEPLHEYQFVFYLGAEALALVTEINGLSQERDVIEHKVVLPTFTQYTQMIPGRQSWGRVTLKKAVTARMGLWLWFTSFDVPAMSIATSKIPCNIVMYNRKYEPVTAWNLLNAWPSKISGPTFNSTSNSFAFEELELVHEGITRVGLVGASMMP